MIFAPRGELFKAIQRVVEDIPIKTLHRFSIIDWRNWTGSLRTMMNITCEINIGRFTLLHIASRSEILHLNWTLYVSLERIIMRFAKANMISIVIIIVIWIKIWFEILVMI
jgi:hypothetical protein